MKSKFRRILLLIVAPLVAFVICFYYMTLIPRFGFGFYEGWISLKCMAVTFIITVVAVIILYKFTKPENNNKWLPFVVIAVYWFFIWAFSYIICVLEAAHELEMMINGYP